MRDEAGLIGVMNTTKWNEIRLAMYEMGKDCPRYRTACVENGYVSSWDKEWFYHFASDDFQIIEWLEIEVVSTEQQKLVETALSKIHVPGKKLGNTYRIYGFVTVGEQIDYL